MCFRAGRPAKRVCLLGLPLSVRPHATTHGINVPTGRSFAHVLSQESQRVLWSERESEREKRTGQGGSVGRGRLGRKRAYRDSQKNPVPVCSGAPPHTHALPSNLRPPPSMIPFSLSASLPAWDQQQQCFPTWRGCRPFVRICTPAAATAAAAAAAVVNELWCLCVSNYYFHYCRCSY